MATSSLVQLIFLLGEDKGFGWLYQQYDFINMICIVETMDNPVISFKLSVRMTTQNVRISIPTTTTL